jgi:hypothetical protein
MRSLVAAVLIPLLVALPVTQVLAQATQQEPQVTSESMGLLSTPVVDSSTVLLLAPGSMEFSPATDSLQVLEPPTSTGLSKTQKIALVALAIIAFAVAAIVYVRSLRVLE